MRLVLAVLVVRGLWGCLGAPDDGGDPVERGAGAIDEMDSPYAESTSDCDPSVDPSCGGSIDDGSSQEYAECSGSEPLKCVDDPFNCAQLSGYRCYCSLCTGVTSACRRITLRSHDCYRISTT
jgi:hypothetical protein